MDLVALQTYELILKEIGSAVEEVVDDYLTVPLNDKDSMLFLAQMQGQLQAYETIQEFIKKKIARSKEEFQND